MGVGLVQVASQGPEPSLLRGLGSEGAEVANKMGRREMSQRHGTHLQLHKDQRKMLDHWGPGRVPQSCYWPGLPLH